MTKKTIKNILLGALINLLVVDIAAAAGLTSFRNPLSNDGNAIPIEFIIARFVKILLGIVVFVSLLMFVFAGAKWMTAGGDAEKLKSSQQTMLWAALGVAAGFAAYTIINTIFSYVAF
jgi:hypothetical protein